MGLLMAEEQVDIIFGKNSPRLSDILKLYESTAPDADGYVEEWGTLRLAEQTLDNLDPEKKEPAFAQLRGIMEILYNTIDRYHSGETIAPLSDHNQQGLDFGDKVVKFDFKGIEYAAEKALKKAQEIYSADKGKFENLVYEDDISSITSLKNTLNAPYNKVGEVLAKSYVQLRDDYSESVFLVNHIIYKGRPGYEILTNGSVLPSAVGSLDLELQGAFATAKAKELYDTINTSPYREEMELEKIGLGKILFAGENKGITTHLNQLAGEFKDSWKPIDTGTTRKGDINIKILRASMADPSANAPYKALSYMQMLLKYELLAADVISQQTLIEYCKDVVNNKPRYADRLSEIMELPKLAAIMRKPLVDSERKEITGDLSFTVITRECGLHNVLSTEYLGKVKSFVHIEKILNETENNSSFPKLGIKKKTLDEMRSRAECYKHLMYTSSTIFTLSELDGESLKISEAQNKIKFSGADSGKVIRYNWPMELLSIEAFKTSIAAIYENDPSKEVRFSERCRTAKSNLEELVKLGAISIPNLDDEFSKLEGALNATLHHGITTPSESMAAATGLVEGAGKIYHPKKLRLWKGQFPTVQDMTNAMHPDSGIELKFKDNRISGKEAGLVKQLEDTLKFHRKPKETQPLLNILSVISLIKSPEKGGDITEIKGLKAEGNNVILGEDKIPFDYKSIQAAITMAMPAAKDKGANLEADFNALIEKFSATIFENYVANPIGILEQKSKLGTPVCTAMRLKEEGSYKVIISEKALGEDLAAGAKAGSPAIAIKNKLGELGFALEYFNECKTTAGKNFFELQNVQDGMLKNKLESMCGVDIAMDDKAIMLAIKEQLTDNSGRKPIPPKLSSTRTNGTYTVTISPGKKIDKGEKETINIAFENMGFTVIAKDLKGIKLQAVSPEQKEFLENAFLGAAQFKGITA